LPARRLGGLSSPSCSPLGRASRVMRKHWCAGLAWSRASGPNGRAGPGLPECSSRRRGRGHSKRTSPRKKSGPDLTPACCFGKPAKEGEIRATVLGARARKAHRRFSADFVRRFAAAIARSDGRPHQWDGGDAKRSSKPTRCFLQPFLQRRRQLVVQACGQHSGTAAIKLVKGRNVSVLRPSCQDS
jgi:hypothetical protein